MNAEERLDNLVLHLERVRGACLLLGKRLIQQGREEFGRLLIARGFVHDVSKFYGMEWEFLQPGPDVSKEIRQLVIEHHQRTNDHHPEYWCGIEHMPEIAIAEMVCDWYARSQEFGTNLREWIHTEAVPRYHLDPKGQQLAWIDGFVDLMLAKPFE